MSFFNRLSASFKAFVNDQAAQGDFYFLFSVGMALFGPPQYATLGFAFASCLYLRHLVKPSVGQA